MAHLSVDITVGSLPVPQSGRVVIQNLGPGDVYFDSAADVSSATGVQLPVGQTFEFLQPLSEAVGHVYVIATLAATDLRYMVVG